MTNKGRGRPRKIDPNSDVANPNTAVGGKRGGVNEERLAWSLSNLDLCRQFCLVSLMIGTRIEDASE
jgi:hypothetical protein